MRNENVVKWELLPLGEGLLRYRSDWDALNASGFESNPLLSMDFIAPLAFHYGRHADRLAVGRSGTRVCAAALMRPGTLRWQALMPAQTQLAPVLLPQAAQASSLLANLPWPVNALMLPGQDSRYLDAAQWRLSNGTVESTTLETTMQIDTRTDFDSYWSARSRNLRNDMRNKWNRLTREALDAQFTVHRTPDAINTAFERYAALESAGWKGAAGTAIRLNTRQGDFYADVMRRFAAREAAIVFELRLGGRLAACELALQGGTIVALLKTTHDETLARYAPGLLLDQFVTRYAFETPAIERLEYYTRASQNQLRWATASRPMSHVTLYRNRIASAAAGGIRKCRQLRNALAIATPTVDQALPLDK